MIRALLDLRLPRVGTYRLGHSRYMPFCNILTSLIQNCHLLDTLNALIVSNFKYLCNTFYEKYLHDNTVDVQL